MSAWTYRRLMARPPERLFHLVFESHSGRALVPSPKRSASPRATSTLQWRIGLKALDPERPIREADIVQHGGHVRFVRWTQSVDATLYLRRKRRIGWAMVKDMFEVSMRWPGRTRGTAGGTHSPLNRVAQQLNERSPETLGFETRAERDLMLVLHRPIEPRARKSA